MSNQNFAILIQGPLNQILLDSIPHYLRWSNVILSTCSPTNDKDEQLLYIIESNKSEKLTITHKPIEDYQWFNSHNIYRQAISTLRGLELCDTKFVIKVRSDEFFETLEPFWSLLDKDKLVCSDFFYDGGYPFQISDHIIASTTENLRRTFDVVKMWCECICQHSDRFIPNGRWFGLDFDPVTEAIIFSSFLRSKRIIPTKVMSEKYKRRYTTVIPSTELGYYVAISNHTRKYYTNTAPKGVDF